MAKEEEFAFLESAREAECNRQFCRLQQVLAYEPLTYAGQGSNARCARVAASY